MRRSLRCCVAALGTCAAALGGCFVVLDFDDFERSVAEGPPVPAASFEIALDAREVDVLAGGPAAEVVVTIARTPGAATSDEVTVSASSLPAGVTIPVAVVAPGASTTSLRVTAGAIAAAGVFPVSILAASRGITREASLSVAVRRVAPPGTLDEAFGDGGITSGNGPAMCGTAIAFEGDGSFLVAGFGGEVEATALTLARYRADGQLDGEALDAGVAVLASEVLAPPAFGPDGKLLALVRAGAGAALARFHRDGGLDPTFGDGGRAAVTPSAAGLAAEASGAVVVAQLEDGGVTAEDPSRLLFGLGRVGPTGISAPFAENAPISIPRARLSAFPAGAIAATPAGIVAAVGAGDCAEILSFEPGGRLRDRRKVCRGSDHVVGFLSVDPRGNVLAPLLIARTGEVPTGGLLRILPAGGGDPTFGTDGIALVGPISTGFFVAAGASEAVYVAGRHLADPKAFVVVRTDAAGALDPAFGGTAGRAVILADARSNPLPTALAIAPDGKILVAACASAGLALARLHP